MGIGKTDKLDAPNYDPTCPLNCSDPTTKTNLINFIKKHSIGTSGLSQLDSPFLKVDKPAQDVCSTTFGTGTYGLSMATIKVKMSPVLGQSIGSCSSWVPAYFEDNPTGTTAQI